MSAIIVQIIIRLCRAILHKVIIVFIDCIVGQMHEQVINIVICRLNIRLSCQSDQTILEEEDPKWINTIEQNV